MRESQLQNAIVDALRLLQYDVEETTERRHRCACGRYNHAGSGVTRGIPDLLVRRRTWPLAIRVGLEIKTSAGRLTAEQQHAAAARAIIVVRSVEQAIAAAAEADDWMRGRP